MKGNDRAEDRRYDSERDKLNEYWKGTIWQKIAQEKQTKKHHGEAFDQPGNIRLHNDDGDIFSKYTGNGIF